MDIEGSEDREDGMSAISDLSREALMDLIRKQNKNKTVSYPKNKYNKSHSKPYELGDEESSSDSSSSYSSFNSSDEIRSWQDSEGEGYFTPDTLP